MAIPCAALNSAFVRVRARLLRLVDRAGQFPRLIRVAFWVLMAVAVAGMLLDHAAWTRSEAVAGPFRPKAQSSFYTVDIGVGVPFWLGMRLLNTDPVHRTASPSPRLLLDGRDIALPHTPRAEISRGAAYWLGDALAESRNTWLAL